MKLKEYIEKNFLKQEFLVSELSVTKQQVSKWVTGKVIPRRKMMVKIHKLTKGKVDFADWFTE